MLASELHIALIVVYCNLFLRNIECTLLLSPHMQKGTKILGYHACHALLVKLTCQSKSTSESVVKPSKKEVG